MQHTLGLTRIACFQSRSDGLGSIWQLGNVLLKQRFEALTRGFTTEVMGAFHRLGYSTAVSFSRERP
jgi:hypothetical protein